MKVMVPVRVKADTKLVRKGLQDLNKEIPQIGRYQIKQTMNHALAILRKPGKKVSYPLLWLNAKQRVRVIIQLKASNNMPYHRTGAYNTGFRIVTLPDGYSLINESDNATFIGGDAEGVGQQPMFQGRYPVIRNVIDNEVEKLPSAVVQHIDMVAKEKGF